MRGGGGVQGKRGETPPRARTSARGACGKGSSPAPPIAATLIGERRRMRGRRGKVNQGPRSVSRGGAPIERPHRVGSPRRGAAAGSKRPKENTQTHKRLTAASRHALAERRKRPRYRGGAFVLVDDPATRQAGGSPQTRRIKLSMLRHCAAPEGECGCKTRRKIRNGLNLKKRNTVARVAKTAAAARQEAATGGKTIGENKHGKAEPRLTFTQTQNQQSREGREGKL